MLLGIPVVPVATMYFPGCQAYPSVTETKCIDGNMVFIVSDYSANISSEYIPAVPTPYHNLVWSVQGRYLEFYFSPGGVHCPWKVQKCLVRALSSIPFLCV